MGTENGTIVIPLVWIHFRRFRRWLHTYTMMRNEGTNLYLRRHQSYKSYNKSHKLLQHLSIPSNCLEIYDADLFHLSIIWNGICSGKGREATLHITAVFYVTISVSTLPGSWHIHSAELCNKLNRSLLHVNIRLPIEFGVPSLNQNLL
jgi:hypothetical protein